MELMYVIIFFVILSLIISYIIYFSSSNNFLMDKNDYPEIEKYIFNNRHIIKQELLNAAKTNNWSRWVEYDKINESPVFSKMSGDEIINYMDKTKCKIGEGKNSWKIFGLWN